MNYRVLIQNSDINAVAKRHHRALPSVGEDKNNGYGVYLAHDRKNFLYEIPEEFIDKGDLWLEAIENVPDNKVIFFLSPNGAPLRNSSEDVPGDIISSISRGSMIILTMSFSDKKLKDGGTEKRGTLEIKKVSALNHNRFADAVVVKSKILYGPIEFNFSSSGRAILKNINLPENYIADNYIEAIVAACELLNLKMGLTRLTETVVVPEVPGQNKVNLKKIASQEVGQSAGSKISAHHGGAVIHLGVVAGK